MPRAMFAVLIALSVCPAQAQSPCDMPQADEPLALARPVGGSIIREFGETWDDLAQKKTPHPAIDLDAPEGEPVFAARAGRIEEVVRDADTGTLVRIAHGGGVETLYGHLGAVSVAAGQCVKAGEQIATVGSSGLVPGPRLHFALMRGGKPVDPVPFLQ